MSWFSNHSARALRITHEAVRSSLVIIEKIQEWDIIKNAIPNMFVEIADKKYKKLLMESRTFVKKIRAIGTNNPEKCRKLLNMLIVENNMENEILVI